MSKYSPKGKPTIAADRLSAKQEKARYGPGLRPGTSTRWRVPLTAIRRPGVQVLLSSESAHLLFRTRSAAVRASEPGTMPVRVLI